MKCPTHKVLLDAVGYSIFDIVMACPECDYEKDVPRTFDNEHIVIGMIQETGVDNVD